MIAGKNDISWLAVLRFFLCFVIPFLMFTPLCEANVPHIVYGDAPLFDGQIPPEWAMTFQAYTQSAQGDALTESDVGCGFDGASWWVEAGNFQAGWTIGETLDIDFLNTNTGESRNVQVVLSGEGNQKVIVSGSGPPGEASAPDHGGCFISHAAASGGNIATGRPGHWSLFIPLVVCCLSLRFLFRQSRAAIQNRVNGPEFLIKAILLILLFISAPGVQNRVYASSFTFNLQKSLNPVSMPLDNSGIADARQLLSLLAECDMVKYWDVHRQQYVEYHQDSDAPFTIFAGMPLFIRCNADAAWNIDGDLIPGGLSYDLLTTGTTNINAVSVPVSRTDVKTADALCRDIPNCDTVWAWDTEKEGFIGHPLGTGINDFEVMPGFAYLVNVTAGGRWGYDLEDVAPPDIMVAFPENNAVVYTPRPVIRINYNDAGTGVNTTTFRVELNGMDRTAAFQVGQDSAYYIGYEDLPFGENRLTASISDNAGNPAQTGSTFYVGGMEDTDPPTIQLTYPLDNSSIDTTDPIITVTYSDQGSGINTSTFRITINGVDRTGNFMVDQDTAYYTGSDDLPPGENAITAEITDHAGNTSVTVSSFYIEILRAIARASVTSGTVPLTVRFTTSGEDPAGSIQSFEWDFEGDGEDDTFDSLARDVEHTYIAPGTYYATLTVTSSTGERANTVIPITVEGSPPVATADAIPSNGGVPLEVRFEGSGTDFDGQITLYEWDFDGDGTVDWSSETGGDTSHTYPSPGQYQAVFRVTDDAGNTVSAEPHTTFIDAGPAGAPTAVAEADVLQGTAPLTVAFTGSGTDPNGDIVLYEWDFDGDGTYDWASASAADTTHTYIGTGLHVARLRVTDAEGLSGSDPLGIRVELAATLSVSQSTVGNLGDMINLTGKDGVTVSASTTDPQEECSDYVLGKLYYAYEGTFWMSQEGDSPNLGADTFVESVFNEPRRITQVHISGGEYYDGYGITKARLDFFDDAGELIHSLGELLPKHAVVHTGGLDNVKRFRLTALEANDTNGRNTQVALSRINFLDETGFTAEASSVNHSGFDAEYVFVDWNSWFTVGGDHPDAGESPWVRINFLSPQTVSRIVVDQTAHYEWRPGPEYEYSGITEGRIELLDETGNVIYSVDKELSDLETIDIEPVENVTAFRITALAANNANDENLVSIYRIDLQKVVNGQYESLLRFSDQGQFSASSERGTVCIVTYGADNLIDGDHTTSWAGAEGDTPNNGVNPVLEITFPAPETVSRVVINNEMYDGTQWIGIRRVRLDMFGAAGDNVFGSEYNLSPASEIDLPDVQNVERIQITILDDIPDDEFCRLREIAVYSPRESGTNLITDIITELSADTTVSIYIKDWEGNVIRTLVESEFRAAGRYTDTWDVLDNDGFQAKDGVYYAVLEYEKDGEKVVYDLMDTTGGERTNVTLRASVGGASDRAVVRPFEDEFLPIRFVLEEAAEVTAFIGVLHTSDTRLRTIYNRLPLPAGEHTIYWDGLDDADNVAQAPLEDSMVLGLWKYSLPENAIFVTGNSPEITSISADPNYFSPFSEKCDAGGNGEGIWVTYNVTENLESVELRVFSLSSGEVIRTDVRNGISAGENGFFWDGKNSAGEYVDIGDYQLGLIATDQDGNDSLMRYALARIGY